MDKALARRAIVIGHLALTAPAIAAILLVPFFGLRMLVPFLLVYYVLAGVTFGWQWHSLALPAWTRWVVRNDVSDEEALQLAHRAGLAWLGENRIGLFALHTTAAAVCGIQRDLSKAGRESIRKRVFSQTVSRNEILTLNEIPTS